MVKVLGISGSPRRSGSTEMLLDEALRGASSAGAVTDKLILNDLSLRPCQGCGGCGKTGVCVTEDDMGLVYDKVGDSDSIIIASPVYFGSVSAQLKTMIDRFNSHWVRKSFLKKPVSKKKNRRGAFLCVGETEKAAFFKNAKSIVGYFFNTLDVVYSKEIFYSRILKDGDEKKKWRLLKKSFDMGRVLAGRS